MEGKRIKQKHDENTAEGGKESHQTTEFEIALCQLGLLFLISHYVAGLFGDGCLSATVTGIAMIVVLCGCLQKERPKKMFSSITESNTEKERAKTSLCPSSVWLRVILAIKVHNFDHIRYCAAACGPPSTPPTDHSLLSWRRRARNWPPDLEQGNNYHTNLTKELIPTICRNISQAMQCTC